MKGISHKRQRMRVETNWEKRVSFDSPHQYGLVYLLTRNFDKEK